MVGTIPDGRGMAVAQGLFEDRKDGFPVVFHTDHVPPTGRCFVECFVQSSDMRVAVKTAANGSV